MVWKVYTGKPEEDTYKHFTIWFIVSFLNHYSAFMVAYFIIIITIFFPHTIMAEETETSTAPSC